MKSENQIIVERLPSKEEIEARFNKAVAELWEADRNELTQLRTQLKSVEAERDKKIKGYEMEADRLSKELIAATLKAEKAEADAAVMREVLDLLSTFYKRRDIWKTSGADKALATNAGKSLLLRLQEAEWLVKYAPINGNLSVNNWHSRRDAFLNPKPQDVM